MSTPPQMLGSAFIRFCVKTNAVRTAFDAKVGKSEGLEKISAPFQIHGPELSSVWKFAGTEPLLMKLIFASAPLPERASCRVTSHVLGGFDGSAIVKQVGQLTGIKFLESTTDPRTWSGSTGGAAITITNRQHADGYGDVEIVFQPYAI